VKHPFRIRIDKARFENAFDGLPDLDIGAGGFLMDRSAEAQAAVIMAVRIEGQDEADCPVHDRPVIPP
jgi:hypothetical protein